MGDKKKPVRKVRPNVAIVTARVEANTPEDLFEYVNELKEQVTGVGSFVSVEYYEE